MKSALLFMTMLSLASISFLGNGLLEAWDGYDSRRSSGRHWKSNWRPACSIVAAGPAFYDYREAIKSFLGRLADWVAKIIYLIPDPQPIPLLTGIFVYSWPHVYHRE